MAEGRYGLALDEARRAIDQQKGDLASIRGRASGLIVVAGLAASFVGGLAIRNNAPLHPWTGVAIGAFIACVLASLVVMLPWQFYFDQEPRMLVAWVDTLGAETDTMTRDLALFIGKDIYRNRVTLKWLLRAYVLGVVMLLAEIGALAYDLRGR